MLTPLVVGLTVFAIYPLVYLIALALTRSDLSRPFQRWEGLGNFTWTFEGTDFPAALWHTITFSIGVSAIQTVLGLAIAYLMFRWLNTGRILRTLILLPLMTPPVMVGIAWKLMLNPAGGWFNGVMLRSGLISEPISFLGSNSLAFPSVMVADTWQWTPFIVILCFAALQSMPKDVYEAAEIDGAYEGTIFWRIVLPLLAPSLAAVFLLRLIMAFKTFDLIYILTFGGPGNATNIASFEIWKTALREFDIGLAAAQTLVLAITVTLVTLPVVFLYNRLERQA